MIHQDPSSRYGADEQIRRFLIFIGISFFGHVALFVSVLLFHLPGNYHLRVVEPGAISVDLGGFNPETPMPSRKGTLKAPKIEEAAPEPKQASKDAVDELIDKAEKMPEPAEPEPVPVKEALKKEISPDAVAVEKPEKEAVVEKPQKVKATKKPLVKKNIDPAKVLANAVKRMEKQAGGKGSSEATSKSLSDRIASLKREVGDSDEPFGSPYGSENSNVLGGGGSSRNLTELEMFQAEVSVRMKNNWVFSQKLAGETKGLEARLVIKILADGTISDVWFEQRSGNAYLDNSAYKTVMKSNPLPPLPPGMPYYHLVLGFTPTGLN